VTFHEAAASARSALVAAGLQPQTAGMDAVLLARHAAGWDLATWLARRLEVAPPEFTTRFDSLIARRLTREPVAYIRGVQEFWGRDFVVTPAVLIPRPDTELLVEAALEFLRDRNSRVVVDLGTGSGCIAISLALEQLLATVHAVDVSAAALEVARLNATRHGVQDRVRFSESALLSAVPEPVDLIVTNPPYVAARDRPALAPEVREHEPGVALYGGEAGWDIIRAVLRDAPAALKSDGCLMMEIGFGQSEHIEAEIESIGTLKLHELLNDLQGIPRAAIIGRQ
jgi:release factor glutamine methyltransferase